MRIKILPASARTRRTLGVMGLMLAVSSFPMATALSAASAEKPRPSIDLAALSEPLQDLSPRERSLVEDAAGLIRENRHAEALATLTQLTKSNPKNSAVRVLRAYALLELGNVTDALVDASTAEGSGGHSAYKCWFLAQVAYLAGDKPLCRREIKHIGSNPTYGPEAKKLGGALDGSLK